MKLGFTGLERVWRGVTEFGTDEIWFFFHWETHQATEEVVEVSSAEMDVFDVLDEDVRRQTGAAVQDDELATEPDLKKNQFDSSFDLRRFF